jgi:putative membrane protein
LTILRILVWWAINLLGLWVAAWLVDGISYDGFWFLVLAALVFGLINLVLRPILILLTLPAVILTLGILILFINAFLLWLTAAIFGSKFEVADFFWAAVLGAIVIWAVNLLLSLLIPQPVEPRGTETTPVQTNYQSS